MTQSRPSNTVRLALLLAACTWMPRVTSAADTPAELPAPAALAEKKADAPATEPKRMRSDPSDGRCDRCGGCSCVRRVCVAKHTEKEVTKICWSYKCEDFCIPGPSIYCGEKCLHDACGCWTHSIWKPTCAEVRTKRVPVKTAVKRKVPSVEWKVEERCRQCRVFCFGFGFGDRAAPQEIAKPLGEPCDDPPNDDGNTE